MVWWIAAIIASIYLAVILFMYLAQPKMVYFPSRHIDATPDQFGMPYEDVAFETEDGVRLHGWFVPADSARATLLFCHGNAGNISNRLESIAQFNKLNLNVFIFDYRGYGKSEGKPGEKGTYLDAEAAWRYLTGNRHIIPDEIITFGRSLGGGVATRLAAKHQPKVLIIESSFTSIPDIAAHHYPFLPVRWLSRFSYDSKENINKVNVPILIIHSPNDEIVPFRHGKKLYDLAGEPKHFLEISGSHNDGYILSADKYEKGMATFLDLYLTD